MTKNIKTEKHTFFSLFLVFSVYHRSWTILARTQSTNILQPQKWASFCYQKQLLAFCSWLCCLVLALLLQVHLITIFFPFFSLFMSLVMRFFVWGAVQFSLDALLFPFSAVFILYCVDLTPCCWLLKWRLVKDGTFVLWIW